LRSDDWLQPIEAMQGWVSPRLEIRFELTETGLEIYRPDGQKFLTPVELEQLRQQEFQRAEEALTRLAEEQQRYQDLLERLRSRGIDPEQL